MYTTPMRCLIFQLENAKALFNRKMHAYYHENYR